MSDCSTQAFNANAIHGEVKWAGGMRPTPLSYARYVNGQERKAECFELDGVDYLPERTCELVETYRGYPCNDYTCSACGKTHCAPRRHEHCPRCGSRVTNG